MIALVPLLQAPFQIRIIQPAQSRNVPDAFGVRPVAYDASATIGSRHSLLVDRLPNTDEVWHAVIGGARRQARKIHRQIPGRLAIDISCRAPHILPRERIVARARMEVGELLLDILRSLPRQRRARRIAAGRSAVAPRAIPNGKILGACCCCKQSAAQHDEDRETLPLVFHRFSHPSPHPCARKIQCYLSVLTNAATASICDLLRLCATGLMTADASGTVGFRPRSLSQLLSVLIM